jgi:hypothetical protein
MITDINVVYNKIVEYMNNNPNNDNDNAGEFYIDKSLYCTDSFDILANNISNYPNINIIKRDSSLMSMSFYKNNHMFNIQYFVNEDDEYYIAIF